MIKQENRPPVTISAGEAGRISVLSPEGAALIGLSGGQSIMWRKPSG